MAEAKTKPTTESVSDFLAKVDDPRRRADCAALVRLLRRVTGAKAVMWGPSIVGFGTYHYVYASGTAGDWPVAAFSPRKTDLTIYVMGGFERHPALMKRLGRYRTGKVCLYIKALADVDAKALEELLTASVAYVRKTYPAGAGKRPVLANRRRA